MKWLPKICYHFNVIYILITFIIYNKIIIILIVFDFKYRYSRKVFEYFYLSILQDWYTGTYI